MVVALPSRHKTPSRPAVTAHVPTRPAARPPSLRRRRLLFWAAVAAVVAAGVLVSVATSTPTYTVSAVFSRAPGLFPGAPVEVLGVQVGTVTSVRNIGDQVDVGLAIDQGRPLPAKVDASLVAPELLGEPSIELDPGYVTGPALAAGAVIPESRTTVPVSTEELLRQLQHTLGQINPGSVGDLVTNLAQDLEGQGQALNTLISGAAGTLQVLATKADSLGQLSGSLAQLTGALDSRTSQLSQLITDYDTVSAVIAQHGTQLGGAITELSQASTALVQLLVPNLGPIESDVAGVTTVGRTLDRNLTSVDQTLSSATALFAGAQRAFTAQHEWIDLNLQVPAGVTGAVLSGLIRDRLAGVCRRISAHHAAGLSATQLATLASCGNPASSYFDPIISEIPSVLDALSSGTTPTAATPAQLLQQGLGTIPGLPAATPTASGTTSPSSAPAESTPSSTTTTTSAPPASILCTTTTTTPSSTTSTTTTTAPPVSIPCPTTTTTTTSPPSSGATGSGTCLGGLLGGLLKCTPASSSAASSPPASGSGGPGGLTAYRVPASSSAPSLTAPAEALLPPLPPGTPGAPAVGHHPHHGSRHHVSATTATRAGGATGGGTR